LPHLESIFSIVQSLTQQIDNYDERIEKIAADHYPVVQGLRTVPGVGTLTALTFVLTINLKKAKLNCHDFRLRYAVSDEPERKKDVLCP